MASNLRRQVLHCPAVEAISHKILHIAPPDGLIGSSMEPAAQKLLYADAAAQAEKPPLHLCHPCHVVLCVHQLVDDVIPALDTVPF